MSDTPIDIFHYLDAKFEAVLVWQKALDARLSTMETAWKVDALACTNDRALVHQRIGKLENWRAYITGTIAVIGLLTTLAAKWGWEALRAAAGAK